MTKSATKAPTKAAEPLPPIAPVIHGKEILHLLKTAADGPTRYAMNGLRLENHDDGGIVVAATNGKALSVLRLANTYPLEAPMQIERESLKRLYKGAKKGHTRRLTACEPLEGHFPPFAEVLNDLPKSPRATVTIRDTKAFRNALKACAGFSLGFDACRFEFTGRGVEIETTSLEDPKHRDRLKITTNSLEPAEDHHGFDSERGFSASLLLDALEAIRATGCGSLPDTLELEWPTGKVTNRTMQGPMVIRHATETASIVVVVMPCRL